VSKNRCATNTPKSAPRQENSQSPIGASEAARRLGVSRRTLERLIAMGKIPAFRVTGNAKSAYRIRPEAIEEFIREGERAIQKEVEG